MRGFQEAFEESFTASGAPGIGDFYPALRWVDRLRGVDGALIRLHARRDAFVAGLVDAKRRSRRSGGRDTEKKSAIDELLSLQEIDPEFYTDTTIKSLVLVSSFSPVNQSKLWACRTPTWCWTHCKNISKSLAKSHSLYSHSALHLAKILSLYLATLQ